MPTHLPVEQPSKIELSVNLRTAAALGIWLRNPLLACADSLIE
jgi:hypothetical protein